MARLGPFLRGVAHTDPARLGWRLARIAQRAVETRVPAARGPGAAVPGAQAPRAVADPPRAVLPPRRDQVERRGDAVVLRFLNRERPFALPMAWHPPELAGIANLEKMHLHYMEWLEGLPDRDVVPAILDWISANPPFRPGYWKGDWNSYALSLRAVVWMQRIAALGAASDPDALATVRGSLVGQLRFLERHLELDLGGNHLLKNLKALLWGAAYFAGTADASRWSRLAGGRLIREIDEQILPDGMHYERSPAYHVQVLVDLVECLHVAPAGPLAERLADAVDRAAAALDGVVHPDGRVSLFNDGGLHMTYAPDDALAAVARVRGRRPAPCRAVRLDRAGYFGFRGPDETVLVDCGAIAPDALPAHGHGDVLAFEWSVGGRRLATDTGVYEYLPGERRARSRATAAHNTVTLDDRDQAEFHGSFRVGRRPRATVHDVEVADDALALVGSHDGYRHLPGRPVHRRTLRARPGRIEVEDAVDGGAGQRAVARVLLAEGFAAEVGERGVTVADGEVRVRVAGDRPMRVVPAPWWPDFGVERGTVQIEIELGAAPCRGRWTLERVP